MESCCLAMAAPPVSWSSQRLQLQGTSCFRALSISQAKLLSRRAFRPRRSSNFYSRWPHSSLGASSNADSLQQAENQISILQSTNEQALVRLGTTDVDAEARLSTEVEAEFEGGTCQYANEVEVHTRRGRPYRNKFIGWVKLSSNVNKAAEAFFKSEGRRRTFITVLLLMICRAGQFVPLPGFKQQEIPWEFGISDSSLAGGERSLEPRLSFFQLGLGPYICASTIMQLVCSWYPPFQRMRKDGEVEKIKSYTWWLTCTCSFLQALILSVATMEYSLAKAEPFRHLVFTTFALMTGSLTVEWISRTITEAGFGQGSTLIICMGILISCSQSLRNMVSSFARTSPTQWGPASLLYLGVFLVMTMCAVLVTEGRRTIKLQFYGFDRFPSTGAISDVEPYIPFDINPSGMLPVLMSSYLLALPSFLARFFNFRFLRRLQQVLNPALPPLPGAMPWLYHGLNAVFIFLFSILEITDGAKDISEYINRIGARIADVKPGRSTVAFLRKVQNSARSWGGILLASLVTVSTIVDYRLRLMHQAGSVNFTSMLFIVGTIIEVRRSFMAYHAMHTLSRVLKRYGV